MEMQVVTMLHDFIKVLCQLMESKDLQVSVKHSLQGGLTTGLTAVVGGLLLGPVGLAIGGALGGIGTAVASKNNFKSAALVIKQMPQAEKEELLKAFLNALKKHEYFLCGNIGSFILKNKNIQNIALKVATDFLDKNYKIKKNSVQF